MSTPFNATIPPQNTPVGQLAYQGILQVQYQAPWKAYVRTGNRYGAGAGSNNSLLNATGLRTGTLPLVLATGKRRRVLPVGGHAYAVTGNAAGTGYVVGDTITLVAQNGGRPIVLKVATTGGGGSIVTAFIIDPGSGLVGGGAGVSSTATVQLTAVAQASTSGVGINATFDIFAVTGWGYPLPFVSA